jgi:hypothetical protein
MRVIAPRPMLAPRRGGTKTLPMERPQLAPRQVPERHHLVRAVRPPERPTRARARLIPPTVAPAPVLRLVVPPEPRIERFGLKAPAPTPAAVDAPGATSVGIVGIGGTRVVAMTPADLTVPGRVDITDFRISLFAGVW